MKEETFKKCVYIVLFILIALFFTKDINFFGPQFYKNIKEVKNPGDLTVLVNKNYRLPVDYIPKDLEQISLDYATDEKYMRKVAKEQFERLSEDAKQMGYQIVAASTYRSYDYQEKLYHYYLETKGEEYADQCSARPGHSEHQTGLSVDVMGSNQDYDLFAESIEFNWMSNHAHEYGFILRYPKGKERVTGFKYEPWHYRYVGVEAAHIIYENNWTLEEYLNQ